MLGGGGGGGGGVNWLVVENAGLVMGTTLSLCTIPCKLSTIHN